MRKLNLNFWKEYYDFRSELDNVAPDNEYITIDSNHKEIISHDVGKIASYFK